MLLIISDASVLIDIEDGGLTSVMFSLSWKFAVPDVLFEEELSQQHSHLTQMGLESKSMSGELIAEAYALHQQYARPSVNDMLALTLAKAEGCQLLTADQALRNAAKELCVEVHGTIWLVEQMLLYHKIMVDIARASFQKMKESGSHLPWVEVDKMLFRYSK